MLWWDSTRLRRVSKNTLLPERDPERAKIWCGTTIWRGFWILILETWLFPSAACSSPKVGRERIRRTHRATETGFFGAKPSISKYPKFHAPPSCVARSTCVPLQKPSKPHGMKGNASVRARMHGARAHPHGALK
mgnify:FL=1|jgi:hypothetical protein